MRFFHTPKLIQKYYADYEWRYPSQDKKLFLTFDDGPIPGLTEYVLDILEEYEAKATFFCVGDNIVKHPQIFEKIILEGHSIGNHTFNHLNGNHTELNIYLENVAKCQQTLKQQKDFVQKHKKALFRPPYGRLQRKQKNQLITNYRIIMWDVLTYDFDQRLAPELCLAKAVQVTRRGSIIVFHDNWKAERNLRYTLSRYLAHFSRLGYQFCQL